MNNSRNVKRRKHGRRRNGPTQRPPLPRLPLEQRRLRPHPQKLVSRVISRMKFAIVGFILGVILGFLVTSFTVVWTTAPTTSQLLEVSNRLAFTIERTGAKKFEIVDVHAPLPLAMTQLPNHIERLLVFREDRRFFEHFGLCYRGLTRAVLAVVTGRRPPGGSGIAQQLVKNLWLGPQRELSRKWTEAVMAIKLTQSMSKREILLLHLNTAPFGPHLYGLEAASRNYFHKSARDLNLLECAMLIETLASPSRVNFEKCPEELRRRALQLLSNAASAGYVSELELRAARRSSNAKGVRPPFRVEHRWIWDYLTPQLKDVLGNAQGRFVVVTTLTPEAQIYAQAAVKHSLNNVQGLQMSLLAMTNDGMISAWVGGSDYISSQWNQIAHARRQPGSIWKLFVYAAALNAGFDLDDQISDTPRTGWPRNYDGVYRGNVTLEAAFIQSLNAATVSLGRAVGIDEVAATAVAFGTSTRRRDSEDYFLGSAECSLLELTTAYATVANGGKRASPKALMLVRDLRGGVVFRHRQAPPSHAINAPVVASLDVLLRGVVANGTGRAADVADVAARGKTGTTGTDAWFIGYTRDMTVGVWSGYSDNRPIGDVAGGGLPAWTFRRYIADVYRFMTVSQLRPEAALESAGYARLRHWAGKIGGLARSASSEPIKHQDSPLESTVTPGTAR